MRVRFSRVSRLSRKLAADIALRRVGGILQRNLAQSRNKSFSTPYPKSWREEGGEDGTDWRERGGGGTNWRERG